MGMLVKLFLRFSFVSCACLGVACSILSASAYADTISVALKRLPDKPAPVQLSLDGEPGQGNYEKYGKYYPCFQVKATARYASPYVDNSKRIRPLTALEVYVQGADTDLALVMRDTIDIQDYLFRSPSSDDYAFVGEFYTASEHAKFGFPRPDNLNPGTLKRDVYAPLIGEFCYQFSSQDGDRHLKVIAYYNGRTAQDISDKVKSTYPYQPSAESNDLYIRLENGIVTAADQHPLPEQQARVNQDGTSSDSNSTGQLAFNIQDSLLDPTSSASGRMNDPFNEIQLSLNSTSSCDGPIVDCTSNDA